uniref:Enoyl-CoA hydratase n=1 Tax=Aplanochytrium stocchinoi TaxID=215587 RepID=A0A7S3LRY8_9STRA
MNSNGDASDSTLVATGARFKSEWTDDPLTSVKFDTTVLEGQVALITMSRPKNRNAWTEIMRNEVSRCVDKASKMSKVRVIILTGDPEGKAFCAGADLSPASPLNPNSMEGDVPTGRPANLAYWRDGGGQAALSIVRSTKPVIAAVNGAAVGVGMTLPLACDMTVAAEDAKVGFVFGKRGLTMECLSSYFLERCVGHKVAMELVLTGRVFKAKEAPSGLFNYVVPKENVLDKAIELASEICETSPMSCMLNRNMIIRHGYNTSPEEAHLLESKSIYWIARQADAKEGINSFLEKRKPKYPMDPFKDSPEWFPWWNEIATKSRL